MPSNAIQPTQAGQANDETREAPRVRATLAAPVNGESADHAHAIVPRDESGDYSCPHCGVRMMSKTARWSHVSACPKNPNPECQWCGRHYSTRELERHTERCPMRAETIAQDDAAEPTPHTTADEPDDDAALDALPPDDDPRDDADDTQHEEGDAPEPDEEPGMDARDALSEAVHGEAPPGAEIKRAQEKAALFLPDQVAVVDLWPGVSPPAKDPAFLADLYRATLYLHAKGYVQPASGEEGEAMWDRYLDAMGKRLTPEGMDELSEVSFEWHPQVRGLLGAAFQPPPKPRVSMSQGFLIGAIGFLLGALVTYNAQKKREERATLAAAQPQTQASALPPATRPPFNPAIHGSMETYRAAHGHLPSPYDSPSAEPPAVGLDRAAIERKKRGW